RHPAAGRTALEIGVLRGSLVESLDDLFGLEGHLVRRAIAEIDHLFRMADRPRPARSLMTGVGARRRIAKAKRLRHVVRQPLNRTREATIADTHEFAVPAIRGR